MLVISRQPGESLVLSMADGTEVVVMFTGMGRSGARLAVSAPRSVLVDRSEVAERKKADGTYRRRWAAAAV